MDFIVFDVLKIATNGFSVKTKIISRSRKRSNDFSRSAKRAFLKSKFV